MRGREEMSEDRKPSAVDYGNLFANFVQIGLLVSSNRKLNQLTQTQAIRKRASAICEAKSLSAICEWDWYLNLRGIRFDSFF
jgi:hypothetical protein